MNVAATTTIPTGTGLRPATGRTMAATPDPATAPEPTGTGSARAGARVLVCDDHLVFAESLAMVFVDAGYRVTAVTRSIDEVLGVLRACPVDVCVLDVGLDGIPVERGVVGVRAFVMWGGVVPGARVGGGGADLVVRDVDEVGVRFGWGMIAHPGAKPR